MQYCYILKSPANKTYVGYTVNPHRRLRQHNQELKGGAKYTKKNGNGDWEMFALIGGFPDAQNAMQCEWRLKHPDRKKSTSRKYHSPVGKIKGINEIFKDERWTIFTEFVSETLVLTLWLTEEFAQMIDLNDIKPQVNLIIVEKLDLETLNLINLVGNLE